MGTSLRISNYLLTLTDKKAFMLFLAGFLGGVAVLLSDYQPMVILPGIVLGYAAIIFLSQRRFFISLSVETKNSPYFMGFLFTLSCLIVIFLRLPGASYADQAELFTFLVPQIGAALSTTIVGLIGRYLIVSFDPAEEEQQELWRMATVELKENASAYQKSQRKLVDLIEDFVASHNEILEMEEEASRRHITVLSETSATLEKVSSDYPAKLKGFLEIFDTIQNRVDHFMAEILLKAHGELTEGTSFQLQKLYNDFVKIAKSSFTKMNTNLEGLEGKIDEFNRSFRATFDKIWTQLHPAWRWGPFTMKKGPRSGIMLRNFSQSLVRLAPCLPLMAILWG